MGLGLKDGLGLRWETVRHILFAWLVTMPATIIPTVDLTGGAPEINLKFHAPGLFAQNFLNAFCQFRSLTAS